MDDPPRVLRHDIVGRLNTLKLVAESLNSLPHLLDEDVLGLLDLADTAADELLHLLDRLEPILDCAV